MIDRFRRNQFLLLLPPSSFNDSFDSFPIGFVEAITGRRKHRVMVLRLKRRGHREAVAIDRDALEHRGWQRCGNSINPRLQSALSRCRRWGGGRDRPGAADCRKKRQSPLDACIEQKAACAQTRAAFFESASVPRDENRNWFRTWIMIPVKSIATTR